MSKRGADDTRAGIGHSHSDAVDAASGSVASAFFRAPRYSPPIAGRTKRESWGISVARDMRTILGPR